ncbi:MAG: PQQ-dependent sugar dehydrogenase [Planctomycetaceae bacterium]|nr:PQQ-dependent sugar dehydrogenase [Planctomycetaceae bacterium]
MKLSLRVGGLFTLVAIASVGLSTLVPAVAAAQSTAPRAPWATSRVVGAPTPPEPYRIVPAFPNVRFAKPTSVEEVPGSDRLLVTEMGGKVFTFVKAAATTQADLVLDLISLLPADLAGKTVSLFDAEFHPRFADNRYLFVCYVHPGNGGHTRVSRFTLTSDSAPQAIAGSELVLITWPSGGHNAGCLEFGKDGTLFITTGDGSGPNPPDGLTTGQTVTDLLGAVLRINVDQPAGEQPYSIPSDNPFVGMSGARGEIWAYGLRNPWKFGIDPEQGEVFVADNGWETWEMIHRIQRGGNCGWPVMEGRASLRAEVSVGPTPIIPPIMDHSHTEANSVIGGPVYRGNKLPGLAGSFVYGDYITGTIWAVKPDQDKSYSCTTLVDTDQRIVAFTQGSQGELFVLDYDFTGQIYELVASDVPDTSATFPRRLSQTGLFKSLETLEPAAGVVPYTVRVDRWVDGAKADRWVAIPGDGRIQLAANSESPTVYPEGTVFVKQLTLPAAEGRAAMRLETQLLHFERGTWRPYSYLWDDAGREATLVDSVGASRSLKIAASSDQATALDRTWHVNAVNECKLCHNAGPKFVLGFTLNQLDRPALSASASTNQLAQLAAQGVLTAGASLAADDPSRLVDPHDASQSLDDRARSYLHANCSMCHHPGGNAIVSFFLRRDLPFDKLNTNKGTGIGTFGMTDAKLIVPGDPYRSVLMYRMSKLGYARMPYIGSRVVDSAGVSLVEQWIRSLPHDSAAKLSAPATAGFDVTKSNVSDLVKSTEGALALTLQLHQGTLSPANHATAVAVGSATSGDVRGLFETFVPESKRRATLGANIDPQVVLKRTGDRERGKLIFFSDGARCRNCHELDDRQKSLGPTLREITKKYPRTADLLQHALQPSLKIEEPFAAYTIVTDDGRVLTGLIVEQNDRDVTIKTLERQVITIARASIEEMRKSEKSLMPDRILSDLTAQEAADLFEYIRSHAPAANGDETNTFSLLKQAKRIVFLGDSITAGGGYVTAFDAWLATKQLDPAPVVINAGLSSETISGLSEEGHAGGKFPRPDLFERLDRILAVTKPDLVFTCYGMNCGIYLPLDKERFGQYQERYAQLKAKIESVGAKHIAITPPSYDDARRKVAGFSYNEVLDQYAAWLIEQRAKGWTVIDLHTAMTRALHERRQSDPMFTFQPDAVHPNDAGHWFIAQQLIGWFGDGAASAAATPQAMLAQLHVAPAAYPLHQRRVQVLKDSYVGAAGHKRPGVAAGLPIAEAEAKYHSYTADLKALKPLP